MGRCYESKCRSRKQRNKNPTMEFQNCNNRNPFKASLYLLYFSTLFQKRTIWWENYPRISTTVELKNFHLSQTRKAKHNLIKSEAICPNRYKIIERPLSEGVFFSILSFSADSGTAEKKFRFNSVTSCVDHCFVVCYGFLVDITCITDPLDTIKVHSRDYASVFWILYRILNSFLRLWRWFKIMQEKVKNSIDWNSYPPSPNFLVYFQFIIQNIIEFLFNSKYKTKSFLLRFYVAKTKTLTAFALK